MCMSIDRYMISKKSLCIYFCMLYLMQLSAQSPFDQICRCRCVVMVVSNANENSAFDTKQKLMQQSKIYTKLCCALCCEQCTHHNRVCICTCLHLISKLSASEQESEGERERQKMAKQRIKYHKMKYIYKHSECIQKASRNTDDGDVESGGMRHISFHLSI